MSAPLLRDIFDFLEKAISFILSQVKNLYNANDHNIAFLTLYQKPMINGLNTGGFDIQESSTEMVQRVLQMLEQFLVSNQTLTLNDSFKVYLKVLSVDHMHFKNNQKPKMNKKRTKAFYKKHFGSRIKANKRYNYYWALDVPDSFEKEPSPNIFKNKCLLTATILGLLQNEYFKSNRKDKRFLHLQNINSINAEKKNHAAKILLNELNLLQVKTNINNEGPFPLEATTKLLSEIYKCQFFIFDGLHNSNKLIYMFPEKFCDELIPIHFYQPNDSKNHLVFIRNLNSYFKANVRICFGCKKIFKTHNYRHLCPKKPTCFSCRRFFQTSSTYIHEKLESNFCDKNTTKEKSFTCFRCNVTCYSKHCFKGHKLICSGIGNFGFKCLKCNKFTYRYSNLTTEDLKLSHICGEHKSCIFCREPKTKDHLCKLKTEILASNKYPLAFFKMSFFNSSSGDCFLCTELRISNPNIFCDQHSSTLLDEPNLAILYHEENECGNFTKYEINSWNFDLHVQITPNFFNYNYSDGKELTISQLKSSKKTQDFTRNLETLQKKTCFLLSDKLLQIIFTNKWHNTTFVCQDEDSQTYMCLLKAMIRNGFCPTIIRNGRKILVIEIKCINLRFITSNAYIDIDEFALADQFDIKFEKVFFPMKFYSPKNFHYQGPVPDLKYFLSALDNAKTRREKITYHSEMKSLNYTWTFTKEIVEFIDLKVWLLALSLVKFLKDAYDFQMQLNTILMKPSDQNFLSPFSYPLCSLGGFVFKLYKLYYLNNQDIYVVSKEYGTQCKNVSKIEYEWSRFMEYLKPDKEFLSAFNNVNGQKYFKEAIPDLYSPITKQAYFFHGCVFHGHYDNCLINVNATADTKTPFGKTYADINKEFSIKQENLLKNNASDVSEVIFRWECHYRKLREEKTVKHFLEHIFQPHPLVRLRPRTCVRGAFFDVFALQWSKNLFPQETLYFVDINGLYSQCAIEKKFMTGKYITLIGKTINNLQICNNKFFYEGQEVLGSILLTIVPPQDLFYPFLLYRTKTGKTINTLCALCAEKSTRICKHNENERSLTSSYMISEIEFALKLNYKILAIHECHIYQKSEFLLKDFIKYLNFFKVKHSDCLTHCKSLNDKLAYCSALNKQMQLSEPFLLKPNNIKPDNKKRNFFKLMANALFGKLEERSDKGKTIFVNKQSNLVDILYSENIIEDLFCISDEICEVQIRPNVLKLAPNRKSNCYIGAQLTAYAREIIYQHIQTLKISNAIIYQVDCDSIIFSLPKDAIIPLNISHAVGHFKHELEGDILSYYSLGPKNYSITYNFDKTVTTVSKVRGFALDNSLNTTLFNDDFFKLYISQFLKNEKQSIKISQFRRRADYKKFKVNSQLEQITFTNDLSTRRFVDSNTINFLTYPYGFQKK